MAAAELLGLIALVIGVAIAAELVGDRLGVPNFLFFVLAGLAVGPPGLGLLHHDVFGENVGAIVGLGVAIIIFHSASGITVETLREAPPTAYVLATVGTLLTFLGAAAVTYQLMDVSAGIALLIGALLVATGATAIDPILTAVPLKERLAHTLEIEALATEVSAGILAVAVFHAITLTQTEPVAFVATFLRHLVIGIVVGAAVAGVVFLMFTIPEHAVQRAPKHASQLYLATAIVTFAIAENIAQEAGVAAVATAGLLLGNAGLPYQEHIEQFEENFATFIMAFVFVVLAAFVEPGWLVTVGRDGLLVAVVLMALVRPAAVLLSTVRSTFSLREQLFLSAIGPRGIIPAGVATLLAIEIQGSNPEAATNITGTVLIVIIMTMFVEGTFANRFAERLGVTTDVTIVVGGGRLGLSLADQYEQQGDQVIIIESDHDTLQIARQSGYAVYHGDGTKESVLRDAGAERATRIVAATDDDDDNHAVALLANQEFDVDTVMARLNHGGNRSMFDNYDVELLTGSQLDLWALDHLLDHSAPDWLTALIQSGGIGTVAVSSMDATVEDVDQSLPERTFLVAITRDGETWIPSRYERIEYADKLTVIGRARRVEEAIEHIESLSGADVDGLESPSGSTD